MLIFIEKPPLKVCSACIFFTAFLLVEKFMLHCAHIALCGYCLQEDIACVSHAHGVTANQRFFGGLKLPG
ncbi:MAG: hypothetical protein LBE21_10355 [Pseudomonadales bacterium]|nr:hypothetical protein [Pseudomonadales bacterium]